MTKKSDKLSFEIIEAMNLPTLVPWRAPSVSEIDLRIERLTEIHNAVDVLTTRLAEIHTEYQQHINHLTDLGIQVYYDAEAGAYLWELEDLPERSEDNES